MTHTIYTYERHNLGDQLVFLHLLRALAKPRPNTTFVHFCNGCHIGQLMEVVADITNIILLPFENPLWEEKSNAAICVWKNHDDVWVNSPLRWDWSAYTLWHHGEIARKMGMESPFACREHLLFDYPALTVEPLSDWAFHFLIGDSAPNSGQYSEWADHSKRPLDVLIEQLRQKYSVRTTSELKDIGYTITEIGRLSQFCQHHIMVPNGPFWPCANTGNHHHHAGRKRIVLLSNGEQLKMPFIDQVATVEEVMAIAKQEGWI